MRLALTAPFGLVLGLLLIAASVTAVDHLRSGVRRDLAHAVALGSFMDQVRAYEARAETASATPLMWRAFRGGSEPPLNAVTDASRAASVASLPALNGRLRAFMRAEAQLDSAAATGRSEGWVSEVAALERAERGLEVGVADEERRELAVARSDLTRADPWAVWTHLGTMLLLLGFALLTGLRERRQHAERLALASAGERLLQDVLDRSPAAVYLTDLSGRYRLVNRAWESATGLSRGEALRRQLSEVWPSETPEQMVSRRVDALVQVPSRGRIVPAPAGDGRLYLDSQFALVDPAGEAYAVGGVATDISEELASKERERLLAAVVSSASDAILTLQSGRITTWNPAAEALFGDQLNKPGVRLSDLAAPDCRADLGALVAMAAASPVLGYETELTGADGTPQHVSLTLTSVGAADPGTVSAIIRDIGQAQRHRAELSYQASHDPLTGLLNRFGFQSELDAATATPAGNSRTLMFLDLDHFKLVNDCFGHASGDALLEQLAARLQSACDEQDVVARLGGDEFAVLLASSGSAEAAMERAEQLRESIARPVEVPDVGPLVVTVSVGVALGQVASSASDWMRDADIAMYAAKRAGRDRAVLYTQEEGELAIGQQRLREDLRRATADGDFTIHYQPVIDLATGRAIGVEALCRWDHPERGPIRPDHFIPLAEEMGLIGDIGTFVWRESVRALLAWDAAEWAGLHLAVNMSVHQLADDRFLDEVGATLRSSPQLRGRVMLELTESALADESLREPLAALRQEGVTVAVDDFGTGYSALSYLSRFPIDCLKIDKSFVAGIATSADADAVLRTVVQLADSLKLTTIVEGIEDADTAALLAAAGCTQAQGFLWSPAVPEAEVIAVLTEIQQQPRHVPSPRSGTRSRRGRPADPAVVARVLQLRAAGASAHTIAAILNKEGVASTSGRQWRAASVNAVLKEPAERSEADRARGRSAAANR